MRFYVVIGCLSVLLLCASAPASARGGLGQSVYNTYSAPMAEGRRVMAPVAHTVHCVTFGNECRKSGANVRAAMTPARWVDLESVNRRVNGNIRPLSDKAAYGKSDVWSLGGRRGDCEDYAITKRHELIARGWSSSSVLLAVLRDRRGRSHAVAVIRTDRGDYVLDNLTSEIRKWDRTGYRWIKRQSARDPRIWVRVEKAAPPTPKRKPVTVIAAAEQTQTEPFSISIF